MSAPPRHIVVGRTPGIVLGAAVGDALGFPVEFSSPAAVKRRYGRAGVTGFVEYWADAQEARSFAPYSDDTQLAVVVLESLLASRKENAELEPAMNLMARGFIRWSRQPLGGHRSPGQACLNGCSALERGTPWNEAGELSAGGCGSVMRAYPFALVFADDPEKAEFWAVEHSKLTHRSPIALAACAGLVRGLLALLNEAEPVEVRRVMSRAAKKYDAETARRLDDAERAFDAGESKETVLRRFPGWAAHDALAAASFVFSRHPNDPRSALLEAANAPGDSDSIGTLVGALLGARHGLTAIPAEWVRDIERSGALLALAKRTQDCLESLASVTPIPTP